ncbi:transposase [bacterium]|nr:transposase [bacterium]
MFLRAGVKENREAMIRCRENGDLEIDKDAAERGLRGIALGRKSWLFFGSDEGGRTAPILTSFLTTCKGLQTNPFPYLRDVFDRISPHLANRLANSSSITGKPLSTPPATSSPNTKIPRFVPDSTCVYRTATAMGKMVLVRLVNAR